MPAKRALLRRLVGSRGGGGGRGGGGRGGSALDDRRRSGSGAALFDTVMDADEFDQRLFTGVTQAPRRDSHDPRVAAVARLEASGQFTEQNLHGQLVSQERESLAAICHRRSDRLGPLGILVGLAPRFPFGGIPFGGRRKRLRLLFMNQRLAGDRHQLLDVRTQLFGFFDRRDDPPQRLGLVGIIVAGVQRAYETGGHVAKHGFAVRGIAAECAAFYFVSHGTIPVLLISTLICFDSVNCATTAASACPAAIRWPAAGL